MTRARAWIGPALVGAIVFADLIGAGALVYWSRNDPGFGVEPDYYAAGLKWDEARAAQERSDRLGWSATLTDEGADGGRRRVTVELREAGGAPVTGATLHAVAFHNARSGARTTLGLRETSPGRYECDADLSRHGLWEFRLAGTRGADRFLATIPHAVGQAGTRGAR